MGKLSPKVETTKQTRKLMTSMVIASLSAIHFFFNRRSALRRVLDYCNVLQKGPVHFHSGCKEGHNCQMRLVKMSCGDMESR